MKPLKPILYGLLTLMLFGLVLRVVLRLTLPQPLLTIPIEQPAPTPPDPATTHYDNGNRLYYEKLAKADSAARLHRFDSTLATW